MKVFPGLGLCLLLAACGGPPPVLFDGEKIKANVSTTSDDKRGFVVVVRDAAGSPGASARSARYGATLYCLERFAGSDVVWADGPMLSPAALITSEGNFAREGRCVQR